MGISRWPEWDPAVIGRKAWNVFKVNWHLGVTAFGGPPVHFKIFHDRFVTKLGWIDEQLFQELFSVVQFLSGPGSTKMLYCINLIHEGTLPALFGFLLWSIPGALGMYGLAIGVSSIGENLPRAVYALLSGLNAATVGIIALAAVELSQKAITDKMSRVLVFLGATAGMLYNALWYFPVLMVAAGIATVIHDLRWLHGPVKSVIGLFSRQKRHQNHDENIEAEILPPHEQTSAVDRGESSSRPEIQTPTSRMANTKSRPQSPLPVTEDQRASAISEQDEPRVVPSERDLNMSWKVGVLIIGLFFVSFTVVLVLRGVLPRKPLLYSLFANMYLAGTIIFGGGPVVIPLLREYVVAEGWVSPRDFLIGLAIIQGFPGPNFNFAVYLGSLTAINGGYSSAAGAFIAYVGIFVPGIVVVHGTMGVWGALRRLRWVKSVVRGVNAAAVGLIYTAVYRLWQIGWIDEGFVAGTSLANDPWWVVVTATSYVGGQWFGLSPPVAIILGAIMGLVRYGIVS